MVQQAKVLSHLRRPVRNGRLYVMLAKILGEEVTALQILPIGIVGANKGASANARKIAREMAQVVNKWSSCLGLPLW